MISLKEKAEKYYEEKKYSDALVVYKEILDNNSNDIVVDIYAKLAIVQRFTKDYSASEETLRVGLKKFPNSNWLIIEYAALENVRENWEEAIVLWEKAKKDSKDFSALNYTRYARAYLMLNEFSILRNSILPYSPALLDSDPIFKRIFIENVVTRIIEIRNKNKALAVTYSENITKLIPNDNNILLKELAISYMHSHYWDKAINVFETILTIFPSEFNLYEYHRLAKSYEMVEELEKYQYLLISAIKKYPEDKNLSYRYIYMVVLSNIKEEKYDLALQNINLLLSSGKPAFWCIDKKKLLELRNKCIVNTEILNIHAPIQKMSIVASREDGLGERLNSILNAVVLSKILGYKFGYIWENSIHAHELQKEAESNKKLVGHAIVDEDNFFDDSFIKKYSLLKDSLINTKTISDKNITYNSLFELENKFNLDTWISPRLELKDHFSKELLLNNPFSYSDAFKFIKFNKPINRSIDLANTIMNNNRYIALHLRSGDVFYGEYRKYVHYTYKGIVLPLAKAIIEIYLEKGLKVVIFGQDIEVLRYLKSSYDITTVNDFSEYEKFNDTQKAMFEITLMSNAESIVAGSSGFAKLASWIGNKVIKTPANYFSAVEQTKIIKDDLEINKDNYSALQTSFAYWYAYYYGRHEKKMDEIEFLLKRAFKFDPKNELYILVLSSIQYKNSFYNEAEKNLELLFDLKSTINLKENSVTKVISAKTMGKYNILEFIVSFEDAANKKLPYASLVMYILSSDNDKKKTYLNSIQKSIKNTYMLILE